MIKQIVVENIESHERTVLDLEQFNALQGSSRSGKSAIMRLLYAFFTNAKLNSRYDEAKCKVTLVTDDGSVEREREDEVTYGCMCCDYSDKCKIEQCPSCGSTKTKVKRKKLIDGYLLEPGDRQFPSKGRGYAGLDSELRKAFPLVQIELSDNAIFPGFRQQKDKFLFDELSAADFNKLISILEGHDIVEDITKLVKKDIRSKSDTIRVIEDDHAEIAEEIARKRQVVEESLKAYQPLADVFSEASELYESLILLCPWKPKLISMQDRVAELQGKVNCLPEPVDVALCERYATELEGMIRDARRLTVEVKRVQNIQEKLLELKTEAKDIPMLIELGKSLKSLCEQRVKVIEYMKSISTLDISLSNTQSELQEHVKTMHRKFLDKNICPFSGWKLAKHCKEQLESDDGRD